MTKAIRDGARTKVAMREAATKLFYEQGYEATSLRAVAGAVGIQVGSLYNHIKGKDELLTDIMIAVMDDLLLLVHDAIDAAEQTPRARFEAAMDCHIRYHAEHARKVFIGNSELRALTNGDRKAVTARRREYEVLLEGLVRDVAQEAGADVLDEKLQTYAILALGAHVASWYKPRGAFSLAHVVDTYTRMSLRQMGIDE
ncbi:TetR family transcriptional regulator [Rhodococcoides trifolii]|uniref:TetR family transcriptional regulator n=1 Tax=Rhodococcoides trifolii TaxID=908250 RepID=A0A917LIU9_9NOCA|nr:TetR/AcrR family transcriptional regulator [Rhodococcus trifolii]GGG29883.1 TetR family transcriptional regulator [Rhodococcus trifolii]